MGGKITFRDPRTLSDTNVYRQNVASYPGTIMIFMKDEEFIVIVRVNDSESITKTHCEIAWKILE